MFSGILSSLASSAMDAASSGLSSGIAGAVSGLFGGGDDSNKARREMWKWDTNWREYMDSTKHRRNIGDLESAGLNPALAYGGFGGGPGVAPGSSGPPQVEDEKLQDIASAREGSIAKATIDKLRADTAASQSVASLNEANAVKSAAETRLTLSNAGQSEIELRKQEVLRDVYDSFHAAGREVNARQAIAIYNQYRANNDYNSLNFLNDMARDYGHPNFETAVRNVEFRNALQALALQAYSMPKASAEHDFYLTPFGKNIAPYLNSAESMSRTIGPGIRLMK